MQPESGQEFLRSLLKSATEPVTILETGPLSTIAHVLETEPSMESKIEQIIWMGGALEVDGNVAPIMEPGVVSVQRELMEKITETSNPQAPALASSSPWVTDK